MAIRLGYWQCSVVMTIYLIKLGLGLINQDSSEYPINHIISIWMDVKVMGVGIIYLKAVKTIHPHAPLVLNNEVIIAVKDQ